MRTNSAPPYVRATNRREASDGSSRRARRNRRGEARTVRLPRSGRGRRDAELCARGDGRQARPVQGARGRRAADTRRARPADRCRRAVRARMAERAGRRRLRRVRRSDRHVHASARAGGRACGREQPRVPAGVLPGRARQRDRLASRHRSRAQRRWRRLARAQSRRLRGHRALLPSGLQRERRSVMAAGARRRDREAGARRVSRGHGLRARLVDDSDGAGVSELDVLRFGHPRGLDRDGTQACGRGGSCGPRDVRSFARVDLLRSRLRPRDDVRRAARHGRSRRRGPARARDARRRRDWDDRGADGRRPHRGQPQPGRPRVLRLLDVPLHAGVAVAGGRAGARRAGWAGAHQGRRVRRGLLPLRHRRSDAVQPGVRSASLSTTIDRVGRSDTGTTAREPDETGVVVRDGVRVHWERYGDGEPTILLLPTWSIYHSRHWKLQIPYLARHFRVLTFDGRGNGLSDRPTEPEAYADEEFAADCLAVMNATNTERAIVVGLSAGARWALLLAAEHPDRVLGTAFVGPSVRLAPDEPLRAAVLAGFDQPRTDYDGWLKWNRHYWLNNHQGFLEFFFSNCFNEPHSTKQIEDCVGWGLEMTPETLVATQVAASLDEKETKDLARSLSCPVLVIHGDRDWIVPHAQGAALAEVTGGQLVTMKGSGHIPLARDPVKF